MMEMLGMVQICEKLDPGVICKQVAGLTNLFDKCVDRKRPNCKFGFGVT